MKAFGEHLNPHYLAPNTRTPPARYTTFSPLNKMAPSAITKTKDKLTDAEKKKIKQDNKCVNGGARCCSPRN